MNALEFEASELAWVLGLAAVLPTGALVILACLSLLIHDAHLLILVSVSCCEQLAGELPWVAPGASCMAQVLPRSHDASRVHVLQLHSSAWGW